MLDIKALLLKLTKYVGSDYFINYNVTIDNTTAIESFHTTSMVSAASANMAGGFYPATTIYRPVKVGRYSDTAQGIEWAWKITYINNASYIYPLCAMSSMSDNAYTYSNTGGWDFVEIYAKLPTQTITRTVATNREYRYGYTANTPSGTSTSALGATETLATYTMPFPSSFFGGYSPCTVAGTYSAASAAVMRVDARATTTTLSTYAFTSISSTGSTATTYNVPIFCYMFFTRPHQD